METAKLLAKGKKVKEIAAIRNLSCHTIKTHSRDLCFKFHVNSAKRMVNRMQILKFIPHELNHNDFPPMWRKYIPVE